MVDYLQVDRRLGPLFGKQPYPAPQSALMQQTAQTVHTLIQHTDHSFQTARSAAMVRPQRLGRRSETTGRYPTLSRVLHSASIRQYQQRCHREYQPVAAHAFERPKSLLLSRSAAHTSTLPHPQAQDPSALRRELPAPTPTALSAFHAAVCKSV